MSSLELRPKLVKLREFGKPMSGRCKGEIAVRTVGMVMLVRRLARAEVTSNRSGDGPGPEDDKGGTLPRVEGIAELPKPRMAIGFEVNILDALAIQTPLGDLPQQHATSPGANAVLGPCRRVGFVNCFLGLRDLGKLCACERTVNK